MVYRLGPSLQSAPDADMRQERFLTEQTGEEKDNGLRFFTLLKRYIAPGYMQNPACGIKYGKEDCNGDESCTGGHLQRLNLPEEGQNFTRAAIPD